MVGTCAQGKAKTDITCTDLEGKLACFSGTGKLRTGLGVLAGERDDQLHL